MIKQQNLLLLRFFPVCFFLPISVLQPRQVSTDPGISVKDVDNGFLCGFRPLPEVGSEGRGGKERFGRRSLGVLCSCRLHAAAMGIAAGFACL